MRYMAFVILCNIYTKFLEYKKLLQFNVESREGVSCVVPHLIAFGKAFLKYEFTILSLCPLIFIHK